MKPLSTSERAEIHGLINAKQSADLEAIERAHPGWEQKLDERCRKIAIGRLKVEKDVAELERIEQQEQELAERKAEVEARIARRMPFETGGRRHRGTCRSRMDLCEAVDSIKEAVLPVEKSKDAAGRKAIAATDEWNKRRAILAGCSTRADVAASGLLNQI